jgi:hypothetical protein
MPEKIVYNPKEDAKSQKNAAKNLAKIAKSKNIEKAAVYPQPATAAKKEKTAKAAKSTKPANVKPDKPVTQFKAKVNKWGFLHVPKGAWSSLPFGLEKPLIARIEGDHITIAAATEKSA